MTTVNLKEIADTFSGAILFDGCGSVRIIECSDFYGFNESFNPVPDGADLQYATIYDNSDILRDTADILVAFPIETLSLDKDKRDTFGQGKIIQEIVDKAGELTPEYRNLLIDKLAHGQ